MAAVKNSYPELIVMQPFITSVEMGAVVLHAKELIPIYGYDAVCSGLAIFRNESANGKKGVNHGYCGTQADCGRWSVDWKKLSGSPIGTCIKKDNGGSVRRFLCFNANEGYKVSLEVATIKSKERGIIDGLTYYKKWVGVNNPSKAGVDNFNLLLRSVKSKL